MNKVIIDIETTGLSPKNATITEIGAILTNEKFEIIDTFETFVRTDYIPPFITKLTGITASMTQSGLTLEEAMLELSLFAKDAEVYAHNAKFDKSFIRHYLEETNTKYLPSNWVDTIVIFKRRWPDLPNYKLETLIKYFDLADKEDHRALSDAKHTWTLLKAGM